MVITMRAAVGLGELDTIAFDLIDGAEMDAVGADHFHMLFDGREVGHGASPFYLRHQRGATRGVPETKAA